MADSFPHPLGGDADVVERDAIRYGETADAIARAVEELRSLNTGWMRSRAIDAIRGSADDVADTVSRVWVRYRDTADALLEYSGALRAAQQESVQAAVLAGTAQEALDRGTYQLDETRRLAETPGPDQQLQIADLQRMTYELQSHNEQLARARDLWQRASAAKEAAAVKAMHRIEAANEKNDLNDSFWDFLGDIFDAIGGFIGNVVMVVLKIVSLVLTVLAVVFAVLALVFPPLAAVAGALFLYAQVVNIVIAGLALLQFVLSGFDLLALMVAALAVLAAVGGEVLGSALGRAANAAAYGGSAAAGDAASRLAGSVAEKVVEHGVKKLTDTVVEEIVDLGGDEAQALYDAVGGMAGGLLKAGLADTIHDVKDGFARIGSEVGDGIGSALGAVGVNDVLGAVQGAGGAVYDAVSPLIDQVKQDFADGAQEFGGLFGSGGGGGGGAAAASSAGGGGGLADRLTGWAHGPAEIAPAVQGATGAKGLGPTIGSWVSGIAGGALEGFPFAGDLAGQIGEGVSGLITSSQSAAVTRTGGATVQHVGTP